MNVYLLKSHHKPTHTLCQHSWTKGYREAAFGIYFLFWNISKAQQCLILFQTFQSPWYLQGQQNVSCERQKGSQYGMAQ